MIAWLLSEAPAKPRQAYTPPARVDSSAEALLAAYYPAPPVSANGLQKYQPITATREGFEPPADMQKLIDKPGSRWKNPAKAVQPIFPRNFAGPVRVRCSVADVSAVPVNANLQSCGEIASDGSLIYRNAFGPGIDVAYRCEAIKTEEFIILRDVTSDGWRVTGNGDDRAVQSPVTRHASPVTFSWDLHANGLKPRLTPGHTIEFCDAQGVPRLRINAPEGKDADGKLLRGGEQLKLSLAGDRLTLACDLKDAKLPVVIDPSWSTTGAMAEARHWHVSSLLNNGKVLISAGVPGYTSCELFNPVTATFSTTGSLNTRRERHTATVLNNGAVLVVGGNNDQIGSVAACELYDPSSGQWSTTGSLQAARVGHTASVLPSGNVLVAGGYGSAYFASCEQYDAGTGLWQPAGTMQNARAFHGSVELPDGKIIAISGLNSGNFVSNCETFTPSTNSWSASSNVIRARSEHTALLQQDGSVLCIGGLGAAGQSLASTEEFSSGNWGNERSMNFSREHLTATLLSNGFTLVTGGASTLNGGSFFNSCELYTGSAKSWKLTKSMSEIRYYHTATRLLSGAVLVTGGQAFVNANVTSHSSCEIFDPRPQGTAQNLSVLHNTALSFTQIIDSLEGSFTIAVKQAPASGTLQANGLNFTYTSNLGFTGNEKIIFAVTDSLGTSDDFEVNIAVTNALPTVVAAASPTGAVPNQAVTFTSTGTDSPGDSLTYLWDFGDGATSTDQNATHAYAAVGSYTAKVTVTDAAGGSASATVLIKVSEAPVGRLTTSDVVAFGNLPFTFDASTSTDPENAIASYVWDFGDGTPAGSGQIISKVYKEPGTYTVTLTITDAAGVSTTISRIIEVLPADQAGLYNGFVDYKVGWNRLADSKDTFSLSASVNIGDDVIGKDTTLAVEIAGQRFTGKLDLKLRDSSNANAKWTVKSNIRKQPSGTVLLTLKVKNASLGVGFNQLGVLTNGDPSDVIEKDIPVRLEIGTRSFEVLVPSEFKFNTTGQKAKGSGES